MTRLLFAVLALRHSLAERRRYAELRRIHSAPVDPAVVVGIARALRRTAA